MPKDMSKKVGGRRNKAPKHTTNVTVPRGKPVMCDGGRRGYLAGRCRGKES